MQTAAVSGPLSQRQTSASAAKYGPIESIPLGGLNDDRCSAVEKIEMMDSCVDKSSQVPFRGACREPEVCPTGTKRMAKGENP
jgi:hypothetical protein